MKDIKRYKIEDGLLDFGIKGGLFVRDEDHAAIVAAKDARISEMNSIEQWCSQRTTSFDILNRKYIALQEQLSHYSMSAGQADQRKSESDAVRVAMGFSADANDVSPSDLVDAIAEIQEQVRALAAEANYLRNEIKQHSTSVHFCEVCGKDNPCKTDDVCLALNHTLPATDAVIREIRAQAVEEYAATVGAVKNGAIYAAAIRSGEQP